MLADRSSWCHPLSWCFRGFIAQFLSSPAFVRRYLIPDSVKKMDLEKASNAVYKKLPECCLYRTNKQ